MTLDVGLEQIIALMAQTPPRSYWIAALEDSLGVTSGAIHKSAAGDIYVPGTEGGSTHFMTGCVIQDAPALAAQFAVYEPGGYTRTGVSVGTDSSNNQYWLASTTSLGDVASYLLKRNSVGTLQWEKGFTGFTPKALTVDTSGNCYVVGQGSSGAVVIKYDSSGAVTWAKALSSGSFCAVALSGSALYCAGHTVAGAPSSSSNAYLVKLATSDGSISWQRSLGGSNKDVAFGVCVDTDGDVVIGGICDSGGTEGILIAKYTSAGSLSWQRKINTGGTFALGGYVWPGDSGTVYVAGTISDSVNKLLVAHIADAGTVTWQNKLNPTGLAAAGRSVYRDSGGVYVAGNLASDIILAKIPGNGSLTGTYGAYTYASAAQSNSDPSLTGATPTNTAGSATGVSSVTGIYYGGMIELTRETIQ